MGDTGDASPATAGVATDSSAEQGLEVGRSPGGLLTAKPGNGQRGRLHELRRAGRYGPARFGEQAPHFLFPGPPPGCGGPLRRIGASRRSRDGPPIRRTASAVPVGSASVEIPQAPASRSGEPLSTSVDDAHPLRKRSRELRPPRVTQTTSVARARYPLEPDGFGCRGAAAPATARGGFGPRAPRGSSVASAAGRSQSLAPLLRKRGRPGNRARSEPQDGRKRQEGNGCSDAETAADEGNSSKGETASRGTDRTTQPPRGDRAAPRNATNPRTGSGAQQTRRADAEETAEVVRNHEGGTRFDGSHRRTEGSASFREWTHRKTNGRGAQSRRIPREEGLGPLRRPRGVLAETRAL
jgi:hypothetical protein